MFILCLILVSGWKLRQWCLASFVEALSGWDPSLERLRASRWGVAGEVDWGRQSAGDPPLYEVSLPASSACLGVSEASSRLSCDGVITPWSVTSSGSRLLMTMWPDSSWGEQWVALLGADGTCLPDGRMGCDLLGGIGPLTLCSLDPVSALWHCGQANGFFPACCFLARVVILPFWWCDVSSVEQINGFSPASVTSWYFKWVPSRGVLPRLEQLDGISPVWVLTCVTRWALVWNSSPHFGSFKLKQGFVTYMLLFRRGKKLFLGCFLQYNDGIEKWHYLQM